MSDGREDIYLVWSHEHSAWWASPSGYTPRLSLARHFTRPAAIQVCADAIPGTAAAIGALPELPVRLMDVITAQAIYRADYPHRGSEPWY